MIRNATIPAYIQPSPNHSNDHNMSLSLSLQKQKDANADDEDYADGRRILMHNPLKGHLFSSTSDSSLHSSIGQPEMIAAASSSVQKGSSDPGNRLDTALGLSGEETTQGLVTENVEGPCDEKRVNLIEVHVIDSDDDPSSLEEQEPQVYCTIPSLPAVAFIMCFGAIIVGLLGFLPFYFVGVNSNARTTEYLLSEAMKGVASITQNSLAMLPAFVHIVTFNYIKRHNTTLEETNLPKDPDQLLVSLLTVLTRFNEAISYLRFVYEGGLYTNAGYTDPKPSDANQTRKIYGGHSRTLNTVPMLEMDNESVTAVEPPNVLGCFDFHREVTLPEGAMNQIVKAWVADPQNSTRWLLASDNTTPTYFNFVMPFIVNGSLGYFEAGSSSDKIIEETTTLVSFLRKNGRIFLVDATRNILVGNSWNQSVQSRTDDNAIGATIYTPTRIYEITEPIILAAMQVVNESGSLTEVLKDKDTALITFWYKGNNAFLNLTKVKDSYGLDLVLGVVVVRADFEKAFSTARTAAFTVTVLVVVIAAIVAVVIAWFVVREMKRLIPQLIRASNLEVSRGDGKDHRVQGWLAYITEIRGIHEAFVRVERSLREMRTFVPAAVMTLAPSDDSHSDADLADGKTRRVRTRFNANIVKDNTNEFSRVDVAMVLVDVHRAMDATEACFIMDIISQRAEEYTGYIESVSSSSFFVNFGTQSQNPLVVSKICRFALEVYQSVPDFMRHRVVCFAVRMPFLVGTCGARHSKARVVFDTQRMLGISKVLWDIGCHVASTTDTLSHFATSSAQIPWYRIDCVRFPDEVSQVTLCELLDPCSSLQDNENMPKRMGDGLSKMCKGEYKEALMIFDSAHSENVQLKRLRKICIDRIASGDTSKYIHLIQDVYVLDSTPSNHEDMAIGGGAAMYDCDADNPIGVATNSGEVCDRSNEPPFFACNSFGNGAGMPAPVLSQPAAHASSPVARHPAPTCNSKTSPTPSVTTGGEAAEPSHLTERAVTAAMGPREFPPCGALQVAGASGAGPGLPPFHPRTPGATTTPASMPGSSPPCGARDDSASEAPSFLMNAFVFDSSMASAASADAVGATVQAADEPQVLRDVNQHEWQVSLYPIGSGAFSFIYLGMSDDGVQVAIKRIPRLHRGIKEEEMVSEVCTCAKLRHPNIVPYISCCVTQSYLAIIMEYMPGGSLHDIIDNFGKLPRTVVRRFMLDIVNGLAYLHESTTHGDVKPHNILLGVDGVCKLSDFGSASDRLTEACCVNEDRLMRGTAVYISPEGARNLPLTSASDIYSLGISFLEMVLGRLPWRWADPERTDALPLRHDHDFVQCLTANAIAVDIPDDLDNDVRELALASCAENPEKRPTAQELLSFAFLI
ncbi:putative serine/threonine protein kinase [Leishmania mexicana MHOM/GT/2001/U1103]|uniref:Serine/threonine protein kinase n=1 Tax=Leishmania mexicana (strain MHOM/GT/2001/U1103) TaxID=929439 RepID=E9B2K5_LEIMU|nr:putative serine/threonine protein kinase [Leishmania mexicana MHOM/GT/2001/U1103]CBZ29468.1 putative serine/threonine protein kinase [Leishmania mexicana MHOM/GT/2001/U1103]